MTPSRKLDKRHAVFTRRALLLGGGQLAVLGLLGAKLYQVQVIDGERYATLAESNRISARLVAPSRGRILDRTGLVIAGNQLNWSAQLVAEQADDIDATLDAFARLIPLAEHERARILRDLRRHRRFTPVAVRDDLAWEEMARIEANAPDLPGIVIDAGSTRVYSQGPALAHLVGYVAPPNEEDADDDPMMALPGIRIGRSGMERAQDEALRGKAGVVEMEVNAVGRIIREIGRQDGTPGQDVGLTIDAGLQQAAIARLGDESASAVVLDARNGEVLAMTTTPSFDPSLFSTGVSHAQWAEWMADRRAPLINKAVAGLYAPGSTFKMAVAAAGLEARTITPRDRIVCPGYLDIGDTRFHCWRKGGHGALDVRNALKHSCDVFFYETARRTGIDRIAAAANRFRLRRRPRHRAAGRAHRPDADESLAAAGRARVEPGRHDLLRHRPGLHPNHAAGARNLYGAAGHRPGGRAASDADPGPGGATGRPCRGLAGARHPGSHIADCARRNVGGGQ